MSPETREKAVNLIANKHLTIDSINEIVTILMLEKTTLLTEVSSCSFCTHDRIRDYTKITWWS